MESSIVQLRACTAIAVIALCTLAGCGEEKDASSRSGAAAADPQALVTRYFASLARGDGTTACGLLTVAARRELKQLPEGERARSCEEAAAQLARESLPVRRPRLQDLRVSGPTATAQITSKDPPYDSGVLLRREGGGWKIAYPPAVLSRFKTPPGIKEEKHEQP
jgi:hypothetical protein